MLGFHVQPLVVGARLEDDNHSFLFTGLVHPFHQRMVVCVDGKHGEGVLNVVTDRSRLPNAGDAQGLPIGGANGPTHRGPSLIVRLIDHVCRNDAELPSSPRMTKGGFLVGRLSLPPKIVSLAK